MNRMKFFFLILFSLSNIIVFANKLDMGQLSDTVTMNVKIKMIKSVKKAYIIYAYCERDSSQFAILSLKGNKIKGEKIAVDKIYKLRLCPYFDYETFPDHILIFKVIIFDREFFIASEGWASNVYFSPDLMGLKLIPFK